MMSQYKITKYSVVQEGFLTLYPLVVEPQKIQNCMQLMLRLPAFTRCFKKSREK